MLLVPRDLHHRRAAARDPSTSSRCAARHRRPARRRRRPASPLRARSGRTARPARRCARGRCAPSTRQQLGVHELDALADLLVARPSMLRSASSKLSSTGSSCSMRPSVARSTSAVCSRTHALAVVLEVGLQATRRVEQLVPLALQRGEVGLELSDLFGRDHVVTILNRSCVGRIDFFVEIRGVRTRRALRIRVRYRFVVSRHGGLRALLVVVDDLGVGDLVVRGCVRRATGAPGTAGRLLVLRRGVLVQPLRELLELGEQVLVRAPHLRRCRCPRARPSAASAPPRSSPGPRSGPCRPAP